MDSPDRFDHFEGDMVSEARLLASIQSRMTAGEDVHVGPGDDAAVLARPSGPLIVSVDQCVEGLHFLPDTDLDSIGRKAVRRAAGDLAAMAASPLGLVATALLPSRFTQREALRLYESIRTEAESISCPLVGGDTSVWRKDHQGGLHLSVTVLGFTHHPVLRSTAQLGDRVCVTGPLGGSFVSGRHLSPPVRIREAMQLRDELKVELHAMIDVSDGLGKDALAIAMASRVRLHLHRESIPCHPGTSWKDALQDGEDHELLFTVSPQADLSVIPFPTFEIGTVVGGQPGVELVDENGGRTEVGHLGWNHGA